MVNAIKRSEVRTLDTKLGVVVIPVSKVDRAKQFHAGNVGSHQRVLLVSIASTRGRGIGVRSELALASDMRFASREKAILSQWEVGAGLVSGGGPMAWSPRLIGGAGRQKSCSAPTASTATSAER